MNRGIFEELVSTIEYLLKDSYVFVTDISTDDTYVSKRAATYFAIESGLQKDIFHKLLTAVYPPDIDEYVECMGNKLALKELDKELCIRFGTDEKNEIFSLYTDVIKQEDASYFVWVLKNESLGPNLDYETDLYGKPRFSNDIALAIEKKQSMVLFMVGLEHMDDLNMVYGQKCGRYIYRTVAVRFIYMMKENTAVYRVNDSGFVFVLKDETVEDAKKMSERIRTILQDDIFFEGNHLPIMSCMSGLYIDDFNIDPDTVQSKLEYTLELSHSKHGGELIFFNDLMKVNNESNLDFIKVIHQSVLNGCDGFFVQYQPIVDAMDGRIVGAEALVRWQKQPYGFVPPGMFIEWMENNSSMYELGNFVLEQSLKAARKFVAIDPDFFVNVNISCKQLERKKFKEDVMSLLAKYNFSPKNLCLEITERCKNIATHKIKEDIEFFQSKGIRMALDDYGTGSASSEMALALPVDEIKVDMSFVRGLFEDPKKQAITKNIINFANEIGVSVCVEGVEDQQIQDFLRNYTPTFFQGYFYSKPIMEEELIALISK